MTRCTVHCPAVGPSRVVRSLHGPIDLDSRTDRVHVAGWICRVAGVGLAVMSALADGDYDLARALARRAQNHERKESRP